jgi:hypothetical protein
MPFPVAMKTIRFGYWKNLSITAIHNYRNPHIIVAKRFKYHKQETTDGRVLSAPY